MSHYHACVWIDHTEARIYAIGLDVVDLDVIGLDEPQHNIHRSTHLVAFGATTPEREFLDHVAAALAPARAILIVGPGRARTELAGHLNEQFPAVARRVLGIQPMDRLTDGEVVAAARRFFHATDRMYA